MERVTVREKLTELFRKYRFVLVVLALGFLLMSLPDAAQEPEVVSEENPIERTGISDALEDILSQIHGVGKVQVMLTEASGAETFFQTDEDSSNSSDTHSLQVETVIISGSDRTQQGLIRKINPPVYLGAIVVCQGADSPAVRLSLVEAVANATGISTDRITVLKMK